MLREQIFAHRHGIACRMGEQTLGWEELHRRALAMAWLLADGHGPVLLYGKKCPEYLIAIVGCLWARPSLYSGRASYPGSADRLYGESGRGSHGRLSCSAAG